MEALEHEIETDQAGVRTVPAAIQSNITGWVGDPGIGAACWLPASLCFQLSPAADVFLHGKVVMEDGSPPPKSVTIERPCLDSEIAAFVASTNPKGEYIWKL